MYMHIYMYIYIYMNIRIIIACEYESIHTLSTPKIPRYTRGSSHELLLQKTSRVASSSPGMPQWRGCSNAMTILLVHIVHCIYI